MSQTAKKKPVRDYKRIYEERRYVDNTKDTEAKIKKDIAEWSAKDPTYALIVEGIRDVLRYRDSRG